MERRAASQPFFNIFLNFDTLLPPDRKRVHRYEAVSHFLKS